MSTNSNIGILNKDGSVEMVYCHWEGCVENNGVILHRSFNDEKAVRKLLSLGGLRSLRNRLSPDQGEIHNVEDGNDGDICVFYSRDLGVHSEEEIAKSLKFDNWQLASNYFEEYTYLYDTSLKEWLVIGDGLLLESLSRAIIIANKEKTA